MHIDFPVRVVDKAQDKWEVVEFNAIYAVGVTLKQFVDGL